MAFHYSLIRFVPDPGRGEFVNLGAVAGDPDGDEWELRLVQNLRRARAIDDRDALGVALGFAARLEDHLAALDQVPETSADPISLELLKGFSDEMQNVVQITPPTPIVAESAETALDVVFAEVIVDPAALKFRFEKKTQAVAATRRAYRAHGVPAEAVTERAPISSGPYEGLFDFAVANGEVLQLVQCWPFQLPNQAELAEQVKAWAWLVRGLRNRGGLMSMGQREIHVRGSEVEVAAVYTPPADGQDAPAFEQAQAAFADTDVLALRRDDADAVGEHAAERLLPTRLRMTTSPPSSALS